MVSNASAKRSVGGAPKKARVLIASTAVWDGSVGWTPECLPYAEGVLERYRKAGFAHISLTIAAEFHGLEATIRHLAQVRRFFAERRDDYPLAETIDDITAAHASGRLAVSFNFQGGAPFGSDPAIVDVYVRLGVRLAILSYNMRNTLGDGCQEPGDAGLSLLGRRFVVEMNRCGMVIDLSHVGRRTSLETVEASTDPVVFSHSNSVELHAHVRNITREVIVACAAKGGVIGINSLVFMLSSGRKAKVDDFVRHIATVADVTGPRHIALGMDWNFYDPFMQRMFAENPGMANLGYPPPPWDSLAPETLPQVVEALLGLGWKDADVQGLLGQNMLRVARRVWRRPSS